MAIHPTAIIDRHAELDTSVEVGPYTIIDGPVHIGAGTRIHGHVWLTGRTQIGEACEVFPFASVGALPQDFHHQGEKSYCRIGNRVIIREGVTIHRGTQAESTTVVGDECKLLLQSHIAHNCELGRGVTIINTAQVAGHVQIGDRAMLSAGAVVHQFVRIGTLAFVAANARVSMDVPPFMMCHGEGSIVTVNVVGMRRAGCSREEIGEIRKSFRTLYRSGATFQKAVVQAAEGVTTPVGRQLIAFLQAPTQRGVAAYGRHRERSSDGLESE